MNVVKFVDDDDIPRCQKFGHTGLRKDSVRVPTLKLLC